MLQVIVRYRPMTLRAFFAMMEYEAKERFWRSYTADTLYMIARNQYAMRGIEYPIKAYSAHESDTTAENDTRTEQEIADSIITRLREVRGK